MKTETKIFIILLCISIIGCKSSSNKLILSKNSGIPIINIDSAFKKISDSPFKCTEFIDSVLFVPLETNEESLLGNGKFAVKILPASEYIYCDLKKFRLFDGKFIGSVGKKGRGPGEFPLAIGSSTDIKDNRVFILANDLHQVLIYDSNTVFIKKLDVLPEIQGIAYMGENNLVLFRDATSYLNEFTKPFEYQILNISEERVIYTKEIKGFAEQIKDRKEQFDSYGIGRNCIWYFNNKVQYYESYTDTIFTIEKNGRGLPRFYVNRRDNKPSKSEIIDNETFNRNRSKYIFITSIFETPRFIFLTINKGLLKAYVAKYDKLTLKTSIVAMPDAFENDLFFYKIGYLKNIPGSSDGIEYLDSPLFREDFLSKMRNTPQSEWSGSARRLYNMFINSNPQDNGILCIYKFKK